ncbi:hypothetical protein COM49_29075 [Bacillus pseudomycoides]|nr:hypothetical protein COO06_27890 [Bacillus pseudomycoides]PGD89957.1 hypothetical protein COM50_27075 [Bacillus pseudomycoides]PGD91426.1 hypothetical protein COM49_29075 [Bacillus pseudomycoides]PHE65591.1 hypothetical protein COF69_22505 [Bacillus pseudomycoides]PHG22508.1 hypothetical protein COI47_12675 [Bacillus pseudomycoides]
MKSEDKKKEIQEKYREKVQLAKESKKYVIEAFIVIIIVILFVVLNLVFKSFYLTLTSNNENSVN